MKREGLRKVEYLGVPFDDSEEEFKKATHTGYFHMWNKEMFSDEGFQISVLFAIVETEDGKIKRMDPEDIKFID